MCSQQQPSRSAKVFSKLPKLQLTCSAPDMCVFRNTHVYSCVCPQQQLVGQPLILGCNPAAIGRPTLACVYSETHMCMPTAAIGRPYLDPWVQPSIDFFFNTCVCAHSRNWPAKVLNVQNLHLASSLGYSATHMCLFKAALGRPTLSCPLLQHMSKLQVTCGFRNTHVYAHKQQLVGQPFTLGCNPQWTASETHMCLCSQQQLVC